VPIKRKKAPTRVLARSRSRDKATPVRAVVAPSEPSTKRVEPKKIDPPATGGLLGLVMIVRNEIHGLEATLVSIRPFIDEWTILDTGSTDGTQALIRHTLADVPGRLFEEPFVDFSTSRNRVLDLHGTRTTFTIMPDSDDHVVGGQALRSHLTTNFANGESGSPHEAYLLNIRRGELSYFLPLVLRTASGWRYSGRVHEFAGRANVPPASIQVSGVSVVQQRTQRSLEATKSRWIRDLEILRTDFAANPDPRTAFYLAQTLDCLGLNEEALGMYEQRSSMGGWKDETFEAMLRKGHMIKRLGRPWCEAQQAYLDAHTFDVRRAEPLYEIADYYYFHARDNLPLTYLFARRAAEIPRPESTLFVDQSVYDWKAAHLAAISAFYLDGQGDRTNAREVGAVNANKAVKARPDLDFLRDNRSFYVQSAASLFGATSKQLPYEPAAPFVAANPSVHFDGKKWRCVVRALNYRIVNGHSYEPPDGVIQSHNVMLELTDNFDIERTISMKDLDSTARTNFPVHGYEDCRLFSVGGRFFCTATVCDFSFTRPGLREIVLLVLDSNYCITSARPLRGSWSEHNQKNWMPLADAPGDHTKIVYSLCPTSLLDLNTAKREAIEESVLPIANPHLRGGSQLVPINDGYLCLVHDVTFSGTYRVYLHRFVWLDDKFVVRKMSDLFYFQHRGIEYAAGLAYNISGVTHAGDAKLVASYSVSDASAHLATFPLYRVMQALREDFAV